MKLIIQVNGIEDVHKVPVLFSVIGGKTYDLLQNLLSPTDPQDKTFDELVEALKCCKCRHSGKGRAQGHSQLLQVWEVEPQAN